MTGGVPLFLFFSARCCNNNTVEEGVRSLSALTNH